MTFQIATGGGGVLKTLTDTIRKGGEREPGGGGRWGRKKGVVRTTDVTVSDQE